MAHQCNHGHTTRDNHLGVTHGSFSIQNLQVRIGTYLHLAHSCQMSQTKAIDNFEHNLSLFNCLCFGNTAEKLHADNLIRHGHGLCRCDKNTIIQFLHQRNIFYCNHLTYVYHLTYQILNLKLTCFTGCLYADNIERANLFKVVLKKANGEKRLEQAYMREYLKRKLGKKKFAYCCNTFMYCCLPFFACPCYLGMMGRGVVQRGVKGTEKDWFTNGIPHFCARSLR